MKKKMLVACLFLVFPAYSQNLTAGGSGTIIGSSITGTTSGLIIRDGALDATTNSTVMWVPSGPNWRGGVPIESRKDDGKGPTIQLIRTTAHHLTNRDLAPATYIALAKSVGVTVPVEEAEILDAIHQSDLTVYNFRQVDQYLYRQAARMKSPTRWVWKPVRESDTKAVDKDWNWEHPETIGYYSAKLYSQRVPMRILGDMKAVLEKIPDAIFLVSDFEAIKPDPFLAVTRPGLLAAGKIWIVDQWDEPGFGDATDALLTMR